MTRRTVLTAPAVAMFAASGPKSFGSGPMPGSARSVLVEGHALAHTAQYGAANMDDALGHVERALRAGGSSLRDVVKLNIALATDAAAADVERVLERRWGNPVVKPAVTLVTGTLAKSGDAVAVDAIGVSRRGRMRTADVGVLPAGPRTYVSGQSANGTIPEATRATMDKLLAALKHQGLGWEHVVQVKSFLDPMSSADEVRGIINGYFAGPVPQVFVEWTSKGKIEIELIAEAPGAAAPIEWLTPPGETASPVFARIARVAHPATIYVSGLFGAEGTDGAKQINTIFADLKSAVGAAGGDLMHLAKATYYVADDAVSKQLNEIRPSYYDPKRPPAASKAPVRAVGKPGRTITLDMIAVPAGR